MGISYMKSILGGPWLSGAQGSRLPLPNGKGRPAEEDNAIAISTHVQQGFREDEKKASSFNTTNLISHS